MDVFALHKAIEGMGGPYKSIKMMNDRRQLLVHFDDSLQRQSSLQNRQTD